MKRILPFVIILAVLGVAVGAGVYFKKKADELRPVPTVYPNSNTTSTANQPATSLEPGADPPHAVGPADAAVTLEEFGDFECPPCGSFHPELTKI